MDTDERARFEAAVLPHLDAAYNLARWLTRDAHAAEDVAQEGYCRAARYFAGFRGGDGRVWLLGIVRRVALDWLSARHPTVSFDEGSHDCGDVADDPAVVLLRGCDRERVRAALEELPPLFREAVVLRELEGLSYQQIAAVAGVPIGTIMSRLARGRRLIQERLTSDQRGEAS